VWRQGSSYVLPTLVLKSVRTLSLFHSIVLLLRARFTFWRRFEACKSYGGIRALILLLSPEARFPLSFPISWTRAAVVVRSIVLFDPAILLYASVFAGFDFQHDHPFAIPPATTSIVFAGAFLRASVPQLVIVRSGCLPGLRFPFSSLPIWRIDWSLRWIITNPKVARFPSLGRTPLTLRILFSPPLILTFFFSDYQIC